MHRLIINADDLGSGIERDRGILQCFSTGIVTSASLLANGPTFVSAATAALEVGLPLGVHLNLSEGRSLSGVIPGLTSSDGTFPGKEGLRRLFATGKVDRLALSRELAMQIERVLDAGLNPDHLDTHQHFFLFPVATQIILSLAQKYAIPALRLPLPAEPQSFDPLGVVGEEVALYRRLAPACVARVREAGIVTPDGLFGMPLLNRLNPESLCALLRALPSGSWELMVHPGYTDNSVAFAGIEREEELVALASSAVRETLRCCEITPITFGDLICAS